MTDEPTPTVEARLLALEEQVRLLTAKLDPFSAEYDARRSEERLFDGQRVRRAGDLHARHKPNGY